MVLRRRIDHRWLVAKTLVHALALSPAAVLLQAAIADTLGADPVAELTHRTGQWALRLLLLCLAMTPLRRLLGAAWPVRFRRMLGLYAFFYACLHLAIYVVLDLDGAWAQVLADVARRPFITVGFLAWLLLLPLAGTSTQGWMRRLGRNWGRLHRAVYAVAVLAVLHFAWLVKADERQPAAYGALLALLLAMRAGWAWQKRRLTPPSAASTPAAR